MEKLDGIVIGGTEYGLGSSGGGGGCQVYDDDSSADLNIGDEAGNVLAEFSGGHFRTKNFDSRVGSSGGAAHNLKNLANVNFIPIFGQSLSTGSDAVPAISTERKYESAIMFNTGLLTSKKAVSAFTSFIPLKEGNPSGSQGETVASGCVEKLMELLCDEYAISPFSTYWDDHKFLFGSFGAGSITIAMLTDVPATGIGYYQGVVNAMQGAKNICDANGWTLNIPAWIWMQGETDQKQSTPKEDYKAQLADLARRFDSDARDITGQENEVKCICYQINSQKIVAGSHEDAMDVPTAQMELIRDNSMFVASSPIYVFDHSTRAQIHLSAKGEKMLGLYCGTALKSVLDGSCDKKGVTPLTFSVTGNVIKVTCHVSCPPLQVKTTWVKEVAHYGFKVCKGGSIFGADIVTDVKVFDEVIEITCSESPTGCVLVYGFTGTSGDDRFTGCRGNICDSAGGIYNGEIDKRHYSLDNYLYSFATILS